MGPVDRFIRVVSLSLIIASFFIGFLFHALPVAALAAGSVYLFFYHGEIMDKYPLDLP